MKSTENDKAEVIVAVEKYLRRKRIQGILEYADPVSVYLLFFHDPKAGPHFQHGVVREHFKAPFLQLPFLQHRLFCIGNVHIPVSIHILEQEHTIVKI